MLFIHKFSLATLLMTSAAIFAAEIQEPHANTKGIRIVPVDPTAEGDEVKTTIQFPKNDELRSSSPIAGQIKLEGFPLGVDSDFPRKREIYNSSDGQTLHICVDNQPYFEENEAIMDALDDFEEYYDQTIGFEIPFNLQPGKHIIRVFPVRSFGESLKGDGCFDSHILYYQTRKDNPQIDLSAAYLTYNEPQGEFFINKGKPQPILLDFYISNCELSKDGYKVRLTIDNEVQRTLYAWVPYYIYGLKKGTHRIRLELLDEQNAVVPGMLNDVERTITVR